jgi:uncharacterized membrane protein YbjE (DUF340 family)
MKNASQKIYYLFLSVIFQTLSVLSMKLYLHLFKNQKSHPYILTAIYFLTYLLFIIVFYSGIPKKKKENHISNLPKSIKVFRKRVNSIKLYKRNSIITIDANEEKKESQKSQKNDEKGEICNNCPKYYCIKNEVIYPSILLTIGHGINIYTLGKINIILHQMMNGSVLICLFRLLKSKEITKIKPNKVVAGVMEIFSVLSFIVYQLYFSEFEISYLFFTLISFFSSVIICSGQYYNFKTIHRYSINFISNNISIGEKKIDKEEFLIEKIDCQNGINNDDNEENNENENSIEDTNSNGGSSEENDNNNKKKNNNHYFSYEKIIFYEGAICFCFWFIFIFISSFIKCPDNNESFIKIFVCNNCTTVSGYESFFNSKEMIIFNNFQYKNKIVQFIYNYPLCTIIFVLIIILTEFFAHFSFQKIFQGKYKTKLIVLLNPIVSLILFGIGYFGKKYSNADSFLDQIVPNIITPSELIVCFSLFLGSIVTYLRIFELNCTI